MNISCSNIVNSVGLVLDIAGVVLIWLYGLPKSISREGHNYIIMESHDEAEKVKAAKYDCLSKIGLSLIILGFAVQLASNFIST